jgi:hypothetical protein
MVVAVDIEIHVGFYVGGRGFAVMWMSSTRSCLFFNVAAVFAIAAI